MNFRRRQIILVFFLAFSIPALQAQTILSRLSVKLSRPEQPYRLEVKLVHGGINLSTYDGEDILIEVRGEEKKVKESGLHQIGSDDKIDIVAEESNNIVFVHSTHPGSLTNLSIKIPNRAVKLKLTAMNQGDVVVTNVQGELEVNNTNGAISLINVSGSALASTVNGTINATFGSVDENAPMAFSALTGTINLTFPAGFRANARLKSEHGEIKSEFALAPVAGNRINAIPLSKGLIQYRSDGWIYGKIGGGGAEIQISNSHGDIVIRKSR